ncbi:MOSC domain-containing protein [Streptomyces sp. URMC 125]|uniref:MOSC domain-containing protein n=1 Tax=Streptomyces sp. URMC 125 TaxID=3423419 RepID=UPI003F1B5C1D
MACVSELISYPVKGCAGVSVPAALVTEAGLAHDRTFMVVGEDGVFRTQRSDPRLALVRPSVGADGGRLTLRAPGAEPLAVEVDPAAERIEVRLFGKPLQGVDQGPGAAAWLSEVLGAPSRLVRVPPEQRRVVDGRTPGVSGYADSSPVHILSRSSLDGLNRRIAEAGGGPLTMDRFRPNVVVDGWDEPHTEDRVLRAVLGEAELAYAKPAVRCAVTLVDQRTGARSGPEPLRTLALYRRAVRDGLSGVMFGAKFSVVRTGRLAVGDEVGVTAWDADRP